MAAPMLLGLDKKSALIYHGDPALTYLDSDEDELRAQPADVKPRTSPLMTSLPTTSLPRTSPPMMSLPRTSLPMSRLLTTSPLMQARNVGGAPT